MTEFVKPAVQLSGTDGNVFSIISRVDRALVRAGFPEKAKEFRDKAFECGSYEEVLQLVHRYVEAS